MPDAGLVLSFLLTSFAIELTPGPNMAWLALLAATAGRATGWAAVAGIALGLGLQGTFAATGLAAVLTAFPPAYSVLHAAGVAYLVWLAWESWRDAANPAHHLPGGGEDETVGFRHGLITNLLNPKAAVFYITVLPGFLPADADVRGALTLTAVYVAAATFIHAVIVLAAGAARRWLSDPVISARMHRVQTFVLLAVALWLLSKA